MAEPGLASKDDSTPFSVAFDIGTSKCSIAVRNGSNVMLLKRKNQRIIKSFVTFKNAPPSSGVNKSLSDLEMLSGDTIFNIKRLLGRVDTDPVVRASKYLPFLVQTLDIGVRPYIAAFVNNLCRATSPEETLAKLLVDLRVMTENHLKRPLKEIVLTVPVSFSRYQRTRLERACGMAGLQVLKMMPEPAAVALLYGQQQQRASQESAGSKKEKIALVFNMGAGFCDVAVIAIGGSNSQIKALTGSIIGGEDLLQNMMRHLLPDFENTFKSRGITEIKSMALLRIATQDAIHQLSSITSVEVDVDLGEGLKVYKVVDRAEFEEVNKEVFAKCESLVIQCLHEAKVEAESVNDVIIVGGCSYIPKVKNLVTNICKETRVYSGISPLEGAVCGAAAKGSPVSGIVDPLRDLKSLTTLAIGIRADGNNFVPIIPRSTALPAKKDLVFTTIHDDQTEALILVYEGEEGKQPEENQLLGYFKITGIPAAPKGVCEITVCMDLDTANKLRVLTTVVKPGTREAALPVLQAKMPMVDDAHGWCADALNRTFGDTMDLVTLNRGIN